MFTCAFTHNNNRARQTQSNKRTTTRHQPRATSIDINCDNPVTGTLTGAPGDVYIVNNTASTWACAVADYEGVVEPRGLLPRTGYQLLVRTGEFTLLGSGTFTVNSGSGPGTITVTVTEANAVTETPDSAVTQTPPPQHYAIERPSDECADGWGSSWQQWANNGLGGDVCTKTVHFDTRTNTYEQSYDDTTTEINTMQQP